MKDKKITILNIVLLVINLVLIGFNCYKIFTTNVSDNDTKNISDHVNAVDYIKTLYETDALANGLKKDTTEDENIRYVGSNPKNYVEFNGETWRIIGIFGSNLKLVRNDLLTSYSFDNKGTTSLSSFDLSWNVYGSNDWSKSYLREFLNDYYYEDKDITCHSGGELEVENKEVVCPTITKLNNTAKGMIQKSTWYLGGIADISCGDCYGSTEELYLKERGTEVYDDHATSSLDYVGLIYQTDYIFANNSTEDCGLDDDGISNCSLDNWMSIDKTYLVISPSVKNEYHVFEAGGSYTNANSESGVRPSVYLKSNVRIVSGSGTEDDMLKLEI